MFTINKSLSWFIAGILFALLWGSASTATKIGLTVAQPLVIAEVRFALAAFIMLLVAHVVFKHRLPEKAQWKPLALYGLLNEEAVKPFWIGFNNRSRSPATDAPPKDAWDSNGSGVWVNGVIVTPPRWKRGGQKGHPEIPLTDEGYEFREPIKIRL